MLKKNPSPRRGEIPSDRNFQRQKFMTRREGEIPIGVNSYRVYPSENLSYPFYVFHSGNFSSHPVWDFLLPSGLEFLLPFGSGNFSSPSAQGISPPLQLREFLLPSGHGITSINFSFGEFLLPPGPPGETGISLSIYEFFIPAMNFYFR